MTILQKIVSKLPIFWKEKNAWKCSIFVCFSFVFSSELLMWEGFRKMAGFLFAERTRCGIPKAERARDGGFGVVVQGICGVVYPKQPTLSGCSFKGPTSVYTTTSAHPDPSTDFASSSRSRRFPRRWWLLLDILPPQSKTSEKAKACPVGDLEAPA